MGNALGIDGGQSSASKNKKVKLFLKQCTTAKEIDLGEDEIFRLIKGERIGEKLTKLGDEGTKIVAEELKHNKVIEILDIKNNELGDEGIEKVAEALKVNNHLSVLDLSWNNITKEGAKKLSEALKINKTLNKINLKDNHIGDLGAKLIIDVLKFNKHIIDVDVDGNNISKELKTEISKLVSKNKEYFDKFIKEMVDYCVKIFLNDEKYTDVENKKYLSDFNYFTTVHDDLFKKYLFKCAKGRYVDKYFKVIILKGNKLVKYIESTKKSEIVEVKKDISSEEHNTDEVENLGDLGVVEETFE